MTYAGAYKRRQKSFGEEGERRLIKSERFRKRRPPGCGSSVATDVCSSPPVAPVTAAVAAVTEQQTGRLLLY